MLNIDEESGFDISKTEEEITWCLGLPIGGLAYIRCEGNNDEAMKEAEKFNFEYPSLINEVRTISEKIDTSFLTESATRAMRERGNYIAHFIAHNMYLLLEKVSYIGRHGKELSSASHKLKKYHNIGTEDSLICFLSKVCSARLNVIKSDLVKHDILYLSEMDFLDIRKGILSGIFVLLKNLRFLFLKIKEAATFAGEVCQIKSVQEDVPLFKEVYNLYSKIECFLEEEYRLDKDFHAKARGIIDQYLQDEDVIIKKSVIQNLMQEIEHLRKEVVDLKSQVATISIEKSQQGLQKSCDATENSEVKRPCFSETIENKEGKDVTREVSSCDQFLMMQ